MNLLLKLIAIALLCTTHEITALAQLKTTDSKRVAPVCAYPIQNKPLNQANISDIALLVWANEAAVATFTYNYVNYRQALADISAYFTPEGWQAYKKALDKSGNLATVLKNSLVVSAVAEGTPIILLRGNDHNAFTWKVQIPLLISYKGISNSKILHSTATLLIVRSPTNKCSIGIKQFDVVPTPPNKK